MGIMKERKKLGRKEWKDIYFKKKEVKGKLN